MRPKLQIPVNVYGIMAITGQSILALLHLSLPVIHKHSSLDTFRKVGFETNANLQRESGIDKNIGCLSPGPYSSGEGSVGQGCKGNTIHTVKQSRLLL